MPRATRSEIDAEIVDRAAGLFARHGFDHTSLQQIADAVRYSKSGLLQHFPSKGSLYQAALAAAHDQAVVVLANAEAHPAGEARDRATIEATVDLTIAGPGVSALVNRIVGGERSDVAAIPELADAALKIVAAFGLDLTKTDDERVVRVISAAGGILTSALRAIDADRTREWRPFIVASAMGALGYGLSAPATGVRSRTQGG